MKIKGLNAQCTISLLYILLHLLVVSPEINFSGCKPSGTNEDTEWSLVGVVTIVEVGYHPTYNFIFFIGAAN